MQRVVEGGERRLIFNLPPRTLKSISISVAWAAYMLGRDPTMKILVISATQELARIHSANFRRLVACPWYQALFPAFALADDGDRTYVQKTSLNGFRHAASIGTGITGHGTDIIIIDDPNKAQDVGSDVRRKAVNDLLRQHATFRVALT